MRDAFYWAYSTTSPRVWGCSRGCATGRPNMGCHTGHCCPAELCLGSVGHHPGQHSSEDGACSRATKATTVSRASWHELSVQRQPDKRGSVEWVKPGKQWNVVGFTAWDVGCGLVTVLMWQVPPPGGSVSGVKVDDRMASRPPDDGGPSSPPAGRHTKPTNLSRSASASTTSDAVQTARRKQAGGWACRANLQGLHALPPLYRL